MRFWRGLLAEYADHLPEVPAESIVTLGEGGTPLLPAPVLSKQTGCEVYLKIEGMNPTGSFKDRGMTVAVSLAAARGARTVICASTGNTSASAAAYAARAGLACVVLVPRGKIAHGKLAQALVYGARLLQVDGNFDDCLELVRKLAVDYPVAVVNSVNPDRLAGQKTAAFEVIEALGDAPDVHCLPVGNAGNITAYWMGYQEFLATGRSAKTPKMFGFQAAGAAPLVSGEPVPDPVTVATAIRIGNPASWQLAIGARDESERADRGRDRSSRSSTLTGCSRCSRRCSASPLRRPASPGCWRRPGAARSSRVLWWSARSPATASKTRTPPSPGCLLLRSFRWRSIGRERARIRVSGRALARPQGRADPAGPGSGSGHQRQPRTWVRLRSDSRLACMTWCGPKSLSRWAADQGARGRRGDRRTRGRASGRAGHASGVRRGG